MAEPPAFAACLQRAFCLSAAAKHYPPRNESALRQLHQQIYENDNISLHHKLSVLYYLLLDVDALAGHRGEGRLAERFAARAGVPRKYQTFMEGLWTMDRGDFAVALEDLAHPSLLPEFADDIVTVLVRHAPADDYSLALAYYHCAQPVLKTAAAVELLFEALSRSNVLEALLFSRARPLPMRQQLFQRLVVDVLGSARGDETAERAFELTSLPFDDDEEQWFKESLTTGDGKTLAAARDTLLMRRLATGNVGSVSEKGSWSNILEAFKAGSGDRMPS